MKNVYNFYALKFKLNQKKFHIYILINIKQNKTKKLIIVEKEKRNKK
jgi:hypothetical protein